VSQLKKLFEPIMVGELELKNRLIRPGVMTNYATNGKVTDRRIFMLRLPETACRPRNIVSGVLKTNLMYSYLDRNN